MRIVLDVPICLVSEANQAEHWSKRSARRKRQRHAVRLIWNQTTRGRTFFEPCRYVVELTRFCPARNKVRDSDNLASAFKAVRDEIAACLGLDDSDLRGEAISWSYAQDVSERHSVRIVVHVQSREAIA